MGNTHQSLPAHSPIDDPVESFQAFGKSHCGLMHTLILHGRRSAKLHKWCNLRVSVNLFQNAFAFSNSFFSTSSAAADVSSKDGLKGKTFTVSCLVESISRKVGFEKKGNPDSVLNLLRSYGFTDSQISSIITVYPRLLIFDAEKSIGPKLRFLQSKSASSSEFTEIVSKVPEILGKNRYISVYYDVVKEIIKADKSSKFQKLCHSLPEGSMQENKIRNVSVLRELGVPQKLIFSLLITNNRVCCGKEKFEVSLKKVVEMGFDPTTSKFVEALQVVQRLSEKTIEEKVNVCKKLGFAAGDVRKIFKNCPSFLARSEKKILNSVETFIGLGFSREEFVMLVKRSPSCIGLSAETVKEKNEFLVKKMNWPLKAMVSHPQVFNYSMEKRIVPRCNVIKALMSKGFLRSELPPMSSVLTITDQAFLKKYVKKHDDKEVVADLMAIFTGNPVL